MITILSVGLALAIATIIVLVNVLRDENKAKEKYEKWFYMMRNDNRILRGAMDECNANFRELKKRYEEALIDLSDALDQHKADEWEIGQLEHQLDIAEGNIARMQEEM